MSLSPSTLFRSSPWSKGATKGGQDCQDHRHPGLPNSVHSEQSSCHKNYQCSKNVQLFRCGKTRTRWCTSSSTRSPSALSLMTMGPSNRQIMRMTLMLMMMTIDNNKVQDHQGWRYYRILLDYQSPCFHLKLPLGLRTLGAHQLLLYHQPPHCHLK